MHHSIGLFCFPRSIDLFIRGLIADYNAAVANDFIVLHKHISDFRSPIHLIAERAELTNKDSDAAVNAIFETISVALAGGDKVQLAGFGTFEVRERPARTGRNPQTKEEIEIPASRTAAFKASKALADLGF